jgi:hypothetical protein
MFKTILSTTAISILAVTTLGQSIDLQAQTRGSYTLSPSAERINPKEPLTRRWFIFKNKPGEQNCSSVLVKNNFDVEKTFVIDSEDYQETALGNYSVSDAKSPVGAGSWVTISKPEITIAGKKEMSVDFCQKIPGKVTPGEYSSAIMASIKTEDSDKGGFQVKTRQGVRIYTTIVGDLKSGIEVTRMNFITPDPKYTEPLLYTNFLKNAGSEISDKVILSMDFRNIGNVFTKLKGKIKLTAPDGKTYEKNFNGDYGYLSKKVTVDYTTFNEAVWTEGKYKAVFEFETPVMIPSNKTDVKDISPKSKVETEFDMTKDLLSKLQADIKGKKPANPVVSNRSDEEIKFGVKAEEKTKKEDKKDENKDSQYLVYGVGGLVIVALITVIVVLVVKQKKGTDSSKKEELANPANNPKASKSSKK